MPKISVIVPVYNVEKFLRRCLDSIVKQSLTDIEIICVNDGSADGSLEILQEYRRHDPRVIVVSQENQGLSAARNTAMAMASGEYIGFVDSDDWIDPDFYEKLYEAAKKYDADVASASIVRMYKSGRKRPKILIRSEQVITSVNQKFKATGTPRFSYVWNKIYRRTALRGRGICFKTGVYFEDVGFTIRTLYYLRKLVTVPGVSYYYWVNTQSITRVMTDKKQQDLLRARKDSVKFMRAHGIPYSEKWARQSRTVYKFFGIPLVAVIKWETIKKYYLFGLIPFFEKRVSL